MEYRAINGRQLISNVPRLVTAREHTFMKVR